MPLFAKKGPSDAERHEDTSPGGSDLRGQFDRRHAVEEDQDEAG
jgi:hypothetical protein